MKKFTLNLKLCLWAASCLVFTAFSAQIIMDEEIADLQRRLKDHYDSAQEDQEVKRYELNVTNSGFCRYRRFFTSGKVEYFSFNIAKFKSLDYTGLTDSTGKLFIRTRAEDVIVQTYNDKKGGDVDSMATYMMLPIKNMEAHDVSELSQKLVKLNTQLLVQK